MNYAVKQFKCSSQGRAVLEGDASAHDLNKDEYRAMWLIDKYSMYEKRTNPDPDRVNAIEKEFQVLYESVNLTRMVAMKLLKFDQDSSKYSNKSPSKSMGDNDIQHKTEALEQLPNEKSDEKPVKNQQNSSPVDSALSVAAGIFK